MGLCTSMAEEKQVLHLFLPLKELLSTETLVPGQVLGEVTVGVQTPARVQCWGEGTV